ncbi:hypothetical protein BD626DRAFT_566106 [Schizophyllum amplum]|uniref:Uncharacterized protein n=1 Tax=Schizophyllum amplum TaxID=97359 RepID=A0A550CQI0_9AGAR|nr:hypothetical protein BD626DRAFT_566106 [Auriculariopsis ampla]
MIKSSLFATGVLERAGRAEMRLPPRMWTPLLAGAWASLQTKSGVVDLLELSKLRDATALMLPEATEVLLPLVADALARQHAADVAIFGKDAEPTARWWRLTSLAAVDIILSAPHI